MKSISCL